VHICANFILCSISRKICYMEQRSISQGINII